MRASSAQAASEKEPPRDRVSGGEDGEMRFFCGKLQDISRVGYGFALRDVAAVERARTKPWATAVRPERFPRSMRRAWWAGSERTRISPLGCATASSAATPATPAGRESLTRSQATDR